MCTVESWFRWGGKNITTACSITQKIEKSIVICVFSVSTGSCWQVIEQFTMYATH
jgi:hypothetical protein